MNGNDIKKNMEVKESEGVVERRRRRKKRVRWMGREWDRRRQDAGMEGWKGMKFKKEKEMSRQERAASPSPPHRQDQEPKGTPPCGTHAAVWRRGTCGPCFPIVGKNGDEAPSKKREKGEFSFQKNIRGHFAFCLLESPISDKNSAHPLKSAPPSTGDPKG